MTYSRISDVVEENQYLESYDFENFFNVYVDKKDNYVFNLNNSMYFDIDKNALQKYVVKHDMQWTILSYILYGTTRFAWLLLKLNGVSAKDVFKIKHAGDVILFLRKEQLNEIVAEVNEER